MLLQYLLLGKKYVLPIVGFIVVVILGYFAYKALNPPQEVTSMSQHEAESIGGVQQSAQNADVKIDNEQAKEVVEKVKYIYETKQEPVYIVQTTGEKAPTVVEKEREAVKADFAIVTDKNDPDKEIVLDKLDEDVKVELNQYNVNAYKKVIRQIEVGRTTDGGMVVGTSIHKKITDDGKYLGVGFDYDTKDKKGMVKLVYSW